MNLRLKKVNDKVYFLNDFVPNHQVTTFESDFTDKTNEWFEEKLSEILNKRHTVDYQNFDKEILL